MIDHKSPRESRKERIVYQTSPARTSGKNVPSREGLKTKGNVQWFDSKKGYGFIGREGGSDIFVHYSGILGEGYRTLQEGDSVHFQIIQGPKGPQAANVEKVARKDMKLAKGSPTRQNEKTISFLTRSIRSNYTIQPESLASQRADRHAEDSLHKNHQRSSPS